jgi:hypothetical protein
MLGVCVCVCVLSIRATYRTAGVDAVSEVDSGTEYPSC